MPKGNARSTHKAKKVVKKKTDLARIEYLAVAARKYIREINKIAKKKAAPTNVKKRFTKKIKYEPKKKAAPKKKTSTTNATKHSKPSSKPQKVDVKVASHALVSLGVIDPEANINGDIFRLDDDPADVMLVFVDPAKNVGKFFILQIITRVKDYVVYSRWGRIGALGQSLHQDFDKVDDAIKCLKTKFKEKTGLTWENRDNPMIGDKYRYIKFQQQPQQELHLSQHQHQPQQPEQPEFDHAISYVTTIKKRFSNEPRTYQQFLEILNTYEKEQCGIREVLEQVLSLFADHPDLLKEFTYFLPEAVQEQAKDRLHATAADAEARNRRTARRIRRVAILKEKGGSKS